ncbi:MAG: DNA-formamidopyrimidine glycosylase family protein [Polyangiaceae bacterium]
MPEGDTILRAATTLHARLAGKQVLRWSSPLPALVNVKVLGLTIARVEAVGKNLFIVFEDGRALHSHMRMSGSWHVYPQTTSPRNFPGTARALIEVAGCVAVCFNAPVVRMLSGAQVQREVAALGPDILSPSFDVIEAARRILAAGERPVGDAIMDQSILSGIGNIYKSESLFVAKLDPFSASNAIGLEKLRVLVTQARRLMQRNLLPGSGMRTTRIGSGSKVWVYKRNGERCFTCGERIRMRRQGVGQRSTYYCPSCQKIGTAE